MIKKIIGRRGIADLPVLATDTSRTSPKYFQITEFPRKFTAGKNVIKLRATGNVLVPDSVIHTEILDANDKPIYHEILNYVEGDGTRVIVVYIYPDTPPGIATVYLAGRAIRIRELRTGKLPISNDPNSPNFKDAPNIKWRRTIPVQPSAENTSEILFISASGQGTSFPRVEINEMTVPFFTTIHPSGSQFQTKKGSAGNTFRLQASPTTIQKVPDSAAVQGQGAAGEQIPYVRSPFGKGVLKFGQFNRVPVNSLSPAVTKAQLAPFISQVSNSAALGLQVMKSQAPLELPGIELPQIHSSGFKFEPDMVGGKITIPGPLQIKTKDGTKIASASYEATIVKLQSEFVADVTNTYNFNYTAKDGSIQKIHGFEPTTTWTASYSQKPNFVTTENSQSYANIIISNLMPATGDIARIRVYQKNQAATGDFVQVNETDVEQQDMLIDETSLTTSTGMGIILGNNTINKYWEKRGGGGQGTPIVDHSRTHLMSALKIRPNASSGFSSNNHFHLVKIKDQFARRIYAGAPYYIEFDAKSFDNPNAKTDNIQKPRIDIYISGSAFKATAGKGQESPTFFINDKSLGKHIGTIEGGSGSRFDNIQAHFEPDKDGDGVPIFVVRAGEWHLSEIHMYPNRLEGFSPSMTRILVPIAVDKMHTAQDFEIRYYDSNGKASKHKTQVGGAIFTGANVYIEGGSNLLSGSIFIGNSVGSGIELAGVSSGFIRSIGYEGFAEALNGTSGPGFLFYSGSVLPGSSTVYDGVGFELVQDANNFFRFRTDPSELDIKTQKFFLGSTSSFVCGSNGNIEISASNFHLDQTGSVVMQGTITAEAGGTIGGFDIGVDKLSATNIELSSAGKSLTLGSGNSILIADADTGIQLGHATFASAPFSVDTAGALKATNADISGKISANSGDIGGFSIDATTISSSNNALILKSTGQITGSKVQFTGGKIAGFEFDDTNLFNSNMSDPSNGSGIRLEADDTPAIMVQKSSDQNRIKMYFQSTTDFGLQGKVGNVDIFQLGSTNQIAGWSISASKLTNLGVHLSASYGLKVFDGVDDNNDFVELKYKASDDFGIKGVTGGSTIFELGSTNQIAGWTFDNEKFQGGSMIIRKDGTIESDGFASNLAGSGFRLTAASGGFLEVENARIRGTLSTAVFEKESVNAVGGQLYVANSTTLTSSADNPAGAYTATDTTMSVVNVSGFAVGEILTLKKVTDTGFSTEYVKVESASRDVPGSDQNFAGKIYIERGLGSGIFGPSQSLGDTPAGAQGYTGSQVIVSTGKLGTGYIRLNANPNDPTTPYIDIVERTGSGVYDVDLKARLGDLSGITDSSFSDDVTGFGLYTQNGYFKGKIEIGSRAAQAPNDNLFLHYNFNGSTNNKILSQTPNGFTASYSQQNLVNFAVPGAVTIIGTTELQGPFASASNAITSSLPAGQNAFSAGFRMSFASESMDKHTFVTRNFPRFDLLKLNTNRLQWRIYSGSVDNDASRRNSFTITTPAAFPIKENDLYHIFVTAKENHSSSIDVYNITSGSYETGASGKITFASSSGDKLFGWPSEFTASSYVKWEHGAPGWFSSNNKAFHGTWHDIRYYKDTVLSTSQMEAIVTNTDAASGGTIIDGDSIQTGKIKSNNFGASAGSELDLDAGTFKLGGSSNPKLEFDGSTLSVDGTLSASLGNIGGVTIGDGKLHVGTGTHNNSNTGFFVDSDGNFSLGDKLVWDGSSLTVSGQINVTNTGDFNQGGGGVEASVISQSLADLTFPPGIAVGGESNLTFLANYESNKATLNSGEVGINGDFLRTPTGYVAEGRHLNARQKRLVTHLESSNAKGRHYIMFSSQSIDKRFSGHSPQFTTAGDSIPYGAFNTQDGLDHLCTIKYTPNTAGEMEYLIVGNNPGNGSGSLKFTPTDHDTIVAVMEHDGTYNNEILKGNIKRRGGVIPYNTQNVIGMNSLQSLVTPTKINESFEHICTTSASLNDHFYFAEKDSADFDRAMTGRLPKVSASFADQGVFFTIPPDAPVENSWKWSMVSKNYWQRDTRPTMTVDVLMKKTTGLTMIGMGKLNGTSYSNNFYNIYLQNNGNIWTYYRTDQSAAGSNVHPNNDSQSPVGSVEVIGGNYNAGDLLRIQITIHEKGATGKVYRNGDFTTPIHHVEWSNRADDDLAMRIAVDNSGGGAGRQDHMVIQKIACGPAPTLGGGTQISGNMLKTGVILSQNADTAAIANGGLAGLANSSGTYFDLNNGILEMRANNAARFLLDSTNNTANIGGWDFTSTGLTGPGSNARIRTRGSGKRIEIGGSGNNITFFNASDQQVLRIDDDVLTSPAHPGMEITAGTVRITNTSDFGDAGAGAPLFVSSGGATLGSNRTSAFFGISNGFTPPAWWTNTAPTLTGKVKPFQQNSCPLNTQTKTKPFHAGVVAEATLGLCLGSSAQETIMCAYLAYADEDGYSFYGVDGPMFNQDEIRSGQDILAFYSSDERQKENIFIIEDALDKIKSLRGVEFDWKDNEDAPMWTTDDTYLQDGTKHDIGVIAQDVQKVIPSAVIERDTGFLAVKYEKLVAVLIEGIKDQQKQIDELTERIKKLEK